MSQNQSRVHRVFFSFNGKSYELYARKVGQSDLYGFVEIEDLLFGERSSIVVDPVEESLRKEFAGVSKILVPFQAIHRIDEVEKQGQARIFHLAGDNSVKSAKNSGSIPPAPWQKDSD